MSEPSENCHGPPFPTAEECANQLMSISTFVAVANNTTTSTASCDGEWIHDDHDVSSNKQLAPSTNNPFAAERLTSILHERVIHSSSSSDNIQSIGNGNDLFEIKVCIEKCHNLCHLLQSRGNHDTIHAPGGNVNLSTNNLWLSYRFMNTVAQSGMLSEEATLSIPMMHTFRIQSSLSELVHYFHEKKNSLLKVHVCTDGEVLGTSYIDIRQLISAPDHAEGWEGRMIHNEYVVKPRGSNDMVMVEGDGEESRVGTPRLTVRLCIDRDSTSSDAEAETSGKYKRRSTTAAVSLSTSSQTTSKTVCIDRASSPRQSSEQCSLENIEKKSNQLNSKEAELSNKEKEILHEVASLERKRCEWEQWRHREEIAWQEKLRQKEVAMLKAVEERVQVIEKERISALELSKNEHDKLETRLRKALIDVEAKERQLKHAEVSHQNERKSKLAELEMREKLMKEELKHSIEIEVRRISILCALHSIDDPSHSAVAKQTKRVKVTAAVEQAVAAQTVAAAATKKVTQMELQMDQLREQHRATPEVALLHQVAELKGTLADSERRIEALKGEKNTIVAEKEQFRANVHKLVS